MRLRSRELEELEKEREQPLVRELERECEYMFVNYP